MKIKDLKAGMNVPELKASISALTAPREIQTKFGTMTTLTEATLKDDSGSIQLILWGKQAEGLSTGKDIEIKSGFVKEFREKLQLGIGKGGSVKAV